MNEAEPSRKNERTETNERELERTTENVIIWILRASIKWTIILIWPSFLSGKNANKSVSIFTAENVEKQLINQCLTKSSTCAVRLI